MEASITLTEQESTLRQLLLDVSTYIGSLSGYKKPELRFTGGWARDKLLGSSSVDIDIGINTMTGYNFGLLMREYLKQPETESKYNQQILGSLAKIEANPEKSKHLETVTTRILGFDIDLVNLRKETYVEDSRNPLMEFGSPEEDALRRDATVNALFFNLSSSEVEDFTGRGLVDMRRKIIKTPLTPLQTFQDDPLRVLRAIRFASRLGFEIAAEDETAMRDPRIKDALRLKISRERIGVEITKMLKGPHPHTALALIDRVGLYNEIFTNPSDSGCNFVDTSRWRTAYNVLSEIVASMDRVADNRSLPRSISEVLLRSADDVYLAWMIVCFVPWAKEPTRSSQDQTPKKMLSAAGTAAREGIKADNKLTKMIDDAASQMSGIISEKGSVTEENRSPRPSPKRKRQTIDRVSQGQAIRRWGSRWRHSVLYALLTEVAECRDDTERQSTLHNYSTWLLSLRSLDLLNADQLKPLVHGKQLTEALNVKTGPWMKKALDMTVEWQLRNPDKTDTEGAIAEVTERKDELGIT